MTIDELCPPDVGNEVFIISRTDPDMTPRQHSPLQLNIDYGGVNVVLPLVLTVRGPTEDDVQETIFRSTAPTQVSVTPRSSDFVFVSMRELYHQRWHGSIVIAVEGDDTTLETP